LRGEVNKGVVRKDRRTRKNIIFISTGLSSRIKIAGGTMLKMLSCYGRGGEKRPGRTQ